MTYDIVQRVIKWLCVCSYHEAYSQMDSHSIVY